MSTALARAASSIATFLRRGGQALRHHPWWTLGLVAAALVALPVLYVAAMVPLTPGVADIRKGKTEQPTRVLSADGQELAVIKRANRVWVKLADMSPSITAALIATEDHRFYDHHGLDIRRTASALVYTLTGKLQGGSTITQQLARNLYPEEIGRAANLTRKVKEAITAFKIESVYTKDEILETYLNTVPFLYNAYGIEMAARTYFDKSASELDVLESATLVGMLKGTSYYNPVLNPARALERRNTVLAQMVKHGKLATASFDTLKTRPLALDFERQVEPLGAAPHFAQQLRRWLIDWADRNGYNLYADGLVVRTTIDSRLQEMASQALTRQADRLQRNADAAWGVRSGWGAKRDLVDAFVRESAPFQAARKSGLGEEQALKQVKADTAFMETLRQEKTRLQAGFLALEPGTGLVRAWVGSRDFTEDQFDHVQQARRQPGSTFKPFVYGAAFEQGARPGDTFMDQAVEIPIGPGQVWRPTDATPPSDLPMTLRDGLARSRNTITAQVMQKVGPDRVAHLAHAMGVRDSKLDAVPALALGTSPVTLREMVAAYGSIANGGNYVEPHIVTRIEDRGGRVLDEFQPAAAEPAMSPAAALLLLDAMRGVIDQGTGSAIRTRYGLRADFAGKTGTTQDNTDGWFIMMHPQLVAGAWVGFNDNRITMQDAWGQGARSALPMVGEFFQQSLKLRLIDAKMRFATPQEQGLLDPLIGRVNDWWGGLFPSGSQPEPAVMVVAPPAPPVASEPPAIVAPGAASESPAPAPAPAQRGEQAVIVAPPAPPSQQAIVVTPPRSAEQGLVINPPRPPAVVSAPREPVQRAIVVAPPRIQVPSLDMPADMSPRQATGRPDASGAGLFAPAATGAADIEN